MHEEDLNSRRAKSARNYRRRLAKRAICTSFALSVAAAACTGDMAGAPWVDPGGEGMPPPSTSHPAPEDGDASAGTTGAGDAGADVDAGQSDSGLEYIPVDPADGAADYVCASDGVIFDLTALAPLEPQTPSVIVSAWTHELPFPVTQDSPSGFVLVAAGLRQGPVSARIGGVILVQGTPHVAALGSGTSAITMPYNPNAPTRWTLPRTSVDARISFGTLENRREIVLSTIEFDFETDAVCSELRGSLTIEISADKNYGGAVSFGDGTTLADLFGPVDTDTNLDGVLDGWRLQLGTFPRSPAFPTALPQQ